MSRRCRSPLLVLAFVLVSITLSACSSARTWTYSVSAPVNRAPLRDQAVAVPPLNDERKPSNSSNVLLYLIPLMPFGYQDLNQPEGQSMHILSGLWQFKPTEDIAKAIAAELQSRRIFRDAFFTFRESDAELVLHGTLKSTRYDGKLITYGLSAYGPLLWFFGLPAGAVSNELVISLRLVDRSSQESLWEKEYRGEHDTGPFWIYAMPEDFYYDTILKKLIPAILVDVETAIKEAKRR